MGEGILPIAIADSHSNFQHYNSPVDRGGGRRIGKNITDLCVCNENELVLGLGPSGNPTDLSSLRERSF